MSALLKVYIDSGHTSEVAHTAQNSTTTAGGTQAIGTVNLQVTSTTSMPAQGMVDIDTAGNLETIAYTAVADSTHLTLAKATTISHATGVAVVQWVYVLAVGDQTNGIINDGTMSTPQSPTNVGTWYVYNAGDQQAQSPTFATSNASPSTTSGFADTLVSITSASASFATSVSPTAINAGSQQQIWVVAEIATGQSNVNNPQLCLINLSYSSI
jgi:hypothetical protein